MGVNTAGPADRCDLPLRGLPRATPGLSSPRRPDAIIGWSFSRRSFSRVRLQGAIMPQLPTRGPLPGRFPTTQWSRVVAAASRDDAEAREALSGLCQAYWYPIYAFVRHRGLRAGAGAGPDPGFLRLRPGARPHRQGRSGPGPLPRLPPHRAAPGTWRAERDRENAAKRGGGRPRSPSTPSMPSAGTPANPPTS